MLVTYHWKLTFLTCCVDEDWDEWQQPSHDHEEDEYVEEQMADREPHCDDPDFIVCIVSRLPFIL